MQLQHFIFNPFSENTYILWDSTNECVIIDPGCHNAAERNLLQQFIDKQQLKPVKLLLTHAHVDHILGNDFIFNTYGLQPEVHIQEASLLQNAPQYGLMFGIRMPPSPPPARWIQDDEIIRFGTTTLRCILVPGHSPGSICFLHTDSDTLISGDVLFEGSIGRTDLPGGDYPTLLRSIHTRLLVLPEKTRVFPGHGNPTTIGVEKRTNPFIT
jgi:glyoxylase-like metal-dependent hydrolase (beta-lactamase superfamily II)